MPELQIISHSEDQTYNLGNKLAASFGPRDIVVLTGDLGAGKTVFVRGLAEGRGLNPEIVNSPSFTFINEYPGEQPLYHFDLYRLNDLAELVEIGFDEYISREGLVVIEWGERAAARIPGRYYHLTFHLLGQNEREITMSLAGEEL